jgi:hypothetical protein
MNLAFPIILRLGNELVVTGPEFLGLWNVQFPRDDIMRCRASKTKGGVRKIKWILESNGAFREVEAVGRRHEWTRPVAFLWNFVQDEFRVSTARSITVRELESSLTGIADRFLEAPHGADLRRLLRQIDKSETVSIELIRAYLGQGG